MSKLFLNKADVVAGRAIEERGVGMPTGMNGEARGKSYRLCVLLEDPVDRGAGQRTSSRGDKERRVAGCGLACMFLPPNKLKKMVAHVLSYLDASFFVPLAVTVD